MLAPHLLGRDPDAREAIWQDLKRELRAYDHMGHGPLDIALWDLAGRRRAVSVARLLGGFRERLPTYASTYHGQEEPGGLSSPEAFADYARSRGPGLLPPETLARTVDRLAGLLPARGAVQN